MSITVLRRGVLEGVVVDDERVVCARWDGGRARRSEAAFGVDLRAVTSVIVR